MTTPILSPLNLSINFNKVIFAFSILFGDISSANIDFDTSKAINKSIPSILTSSTLVPILGLANPNIKEIKENTINVFLIFTFFEE